MLQRSSFIASASVILKLSGLAVAIYLSYTALIDDGALICGQSGGCHDVQGSEYSKVAGIPISLFGLFMYLTLLGLFFTRAQIIHKKYFDSRERLVRNIKIWSLLIATAGTVYSIYLTAIEAFVLEAWCIWCLASAVIISLIFIVEVIEVKNINKTTS